MPGYTRATHRRFLGSPAGGEVSMVSQIGQGDRGYAGWWTEYWYNLVKPINI